MFKTSNKYNKIRLKGLNQYIVKNED